MVVYELGSRGVEIWGLLPDALAMPLIWTPFLYPPDLRGDGY